ncbi:hypothetical protein SAMN05444162_4972 [Paenibacillaceae bacterium GAS479]|nr:hypothetical protein SAMN05444162_4972 [Paenibacillaceae bacterium GAS479]
MRSTGFGMILILFILLVIATTVVYSPTQGNNQPDDDLITIQGSQGFNIYNRTSYFTLETASLDGEFEPPFPASHIILPYRSYHFEVLAKAYATYRAYVTYNVLSDRDVVGRISILLRVFSTSIPEPTTEILFINGPISYNKTNTSVSVLNL